MLRLPQAAWPGTVGNMLGAVTAAGAFAAFLSTSSGLLVSISGTISYDVWPRIARESATTSAIRRRRFRIAAAWAWSRRSSLPSSRRGSTSACSSAGRSRSPRARSARCSCSGSGGPADRDGSRGRHGRGWRRRDERYRRRARAAASPTGSPAHCSRSRRSVSVPIAFLAMIVVSLRSAERLLPMPRCWRFTPPKVSTSRTSVWGTRSCSVLERWASRAWPIGRGLASAPCSRVLRWCGADGRRRPRAGSLSRARAAAPASGRRRRRGARAPRARAGSLAGVDDRVAPLVQADPLGEQLARRGRGRAHSIGLTRIRISARRARSGTASTRLGAARVAGSVAGVVVERRRRTCAARSRRSGRGRRGGGTRRGRGARRVQRCEVGERAARRLALGDAVQRARDRRGAVHARPALVGGLGREVDRDADRLGHRTGARRQRDDDPAAERRAVCGERRVRELELARAAPRGSHEPK